MAKVTPSLEDRITKLEAALAHYQHEYDALNEVVIQQGVETKKLRHQLAGLKSVLQDLQQRLPDEIESEERPPHY